jgi:N-acyl-L-homoserine lactone synthetase
VIASVPKTGSSHLAVHVAAPFSTDAQGEASRTHVCHSPHVESAPARRTAEAVVKIASCAGDWISAFALIYDAYVRSDLALPNPCRLRVTPYQLLPTTEILIATHRNRVICTMSLVRDGLLGLPLEDVYAEQVAWRRQQGIHVAEVSCFADHQPDQKAGFSVTVALMSLIAQCAKSRGVDELLIAIHPRHAPFYERFLGFATIGEERTYATVRNHPAVAMSLDLNRLADTHPRSYARLFGTTFPSAALAHHAMPEYLREELAIALSVIATSNEPLNECAGPAVRGNRCGRCGCCRLPS